MAQLRTSPLISLIKQYKRTFFIYIFVGGGCALVNWAVFYGLVTWRMHPLLAGVLAFLVSCTVNFIVCRKVFTSAGRKKKEEFILILLVSTLALCIDLSTMYFLVSCVSMNLMLAKILGTGTAFLVNYSFRQFFIFSPLNSAVAKR